MQTDHCGFTFAPCRLQPSARLLLAAQQQLQGLRQVRQVTEKRRQEWLDIQQQRKALETLQSRKAAKEALKAARQEQKLLDEFATFRYFHRQAES